MQEHTGIEKCLNSTEGINAIYYAVLTILKLTLEKMGVSSNNFWFINWVVLALDMVVYTFPKPVI